MQAAQGTTCATLQPVCQVSRELLVWERIKLASDLNTGNGLQEVLHPRRVLCNVPGAIRCFKEEDPGPAKGGL